MDVKTAKTTEDEKRREHKSVCTLSGGKANLIKPPAPSTSPVMPLTGLDSVVTAYNANGKETQMQ